MRKADGLNRFVLAASFAIATIWVAGGAAHGATPCRHNKMRDCAGVCGGTNVPDCAGVCGGSAVKDCAGVCDGSAVKDCAGACGGSAVKDCAGDCNGTATNDCAGVCNGPATKDCAGVCNGTAMEDCFGNCGTQQPCGEECCPAGATCCHNCNSIGICGVPEFICANTNTDPNNCGGCFFACISGACANGSCVSP